MNSIEVSIVIIWMNSSFVRLLQVMADMEESGVVEVVAKVAIFAVGGGKACEPIVGDEDAGLYLVNATVFKACFIKHSYLEYHLTSSIALIRSWKNVSVMEEHHSNSSLIPLMDRKLDSLVLDLNLDVGLVFNSGWIVGEIPSLSLSVSLIVRRDYGNLLSKVDQPDSELVNHHTKSSDSGPPSKFRCGKHELSQLVGLAHSVCCSHWWEHSVSASLVADALGHG